MSAQAVLSQPRPLTPLAPRPPVEHEVKSWPHLFEAASSGVKTHDLRRCGDRDYRVGDTMMLREYDPDRKRYTGRRQRVRITFVTSAEFPCALSDAGLAPGFCILSISRVGPAIG